MGVEEAYPVPRSALLYIEARGGDERRSDSDGGGAWSQAGVGWHAASEGVARDGTGLTGAKRRGQPFGVGFGWSKLANEALWARRVAVVQGPVVFAPLERGLSLSLSAAAISFSYVRHQGQRLCELHCDFTTGLSVHAAKRRQHLQRRAPQVLLPRRRSTQARVRFLIPDQQVFAGVGNRFSARSCCSNYFYLFVFNKNKNNVRKLV